MPHSRLKKVSKSVPPATKKKPSSPEKAVRAEQSLPALPRESGFTIGDRVSHPKFGYGIINAIEGDKLTIEFRGKIAKQILDYYVKRRAR